MNHYGIAREAATIYGFEAAPFDSRSTRRQAWLRLSSPIEDPTLCGRFTARVLRNVKIQPSTGIVAKRFRLLEQKPISNAVDATNYVTPRHGPTHPRLRPRQARRRHRRAPRPQGRKAQEHSTGSSAPSTPKTSSSPTRKSRSPSPESWADGTRMITAETKNVLVEAAWFDPVTIRRASSATACTPTPPIASSAEPTSTPRPSPHALVSRILLEAGGEQIGELVDVIIPKPKPAPQSAPAIAFSVAKSGGSSGATEDTEGITAATAETILTGLGCALQDLLRREPTGHAAKLASRPRTRDRPDRGGRPRLRLQPLPQHAPCLRRIGRRTTVGEQKNPPYAGPSSPSAGARPSPPPSAPPMTPRSSRLSPTRPWQWAIPSAKKPACCARRSFPACSHAGAESQPRR